MQSRALLALVFLTVAPVAASAQFTTYIAPAKKVDTMKTPTVAEARAKADSVSRASLTNMKAWVDSAAGLAKPESTVVASTTTTTVDTALTTVHAARHGRHVTTTFSNGAPAPATASDLPLLLVLGVGALGVGAALLAGRTRA